MATAILQLDIDRLPPAVDVAKDCPQALVLVRRRGIPVGQFYVPVRAGSLDMESCCRSLAIATRRRRWQWEVDDYLGLADAIGSLPAATVAICTRERPDDLARALGAATALRPSPAHILVVDNNPASSRTQEVVAGFANVRYLREDRPGLDAARNRALAEADDPIVAFTDDDAVPEPAWLGYLLQPFEDPRVLCTSGLTLAFELETPAQEWFERYSPFGRGFDRQVFDGTRAIRSRWREIGAGVNMALRRNIVEVVGRFDEALDAGTRTKSGGDHEMFGRILAAGYRIRVRTACPQLASPPPHLGRAVRRAARLRRRRLCRLDAQADLRARARCPATCLQMVVPQPDAAFVAGASTRAGECSAGPGPGGAARLCLRTRRVFQGSTAGPGGGGAVTSASPTLAIIIPTHDRRAAVERALRALSCQSYLPEWTEIIVVADGCSDGTADIATVGWAVPMRIIEQTRQGPAAARNRGAAAATADILIFLDDDIEVWPGFVAAHLEAQGNDPARVVIGYLPPDLQGRRDFFAVMLRGWWEAMFDRMRESWPPLLVLRSAQRELLDSPLSIRGGSRL